MLENHVPIFHSLNTRVFLPAADPQGGLLDAATSLFNRALNRGRLGRLWAWVLRKPDHLLCLEDAAPRIASRHAAGLRSVPLARINGTLGRKTDFDRRFNPLSAHLRDRWLNVAVARLQGTGLPAVTLIRAGESFFVQDGHHRVSVARALEEAEIDADVTAWDVAGPAPGLEPASCAPTRSPEPLTWG